MVEAFMIDPVTRAGKVEEESENSALNPLWPSVAPGTVKQTVTSSSVWKVVVAGGASGADRLLPQNFDLPLTAGLMVTQLALESDAELWIWKYMF